MKILHLVSPSKSEIDYKISIFPDGQQNIELIPYLNDDESEVTIHSRLNNFMDLELIICSVKSLNNLGVRNIQLNVPYFLGSRSDRKFLTGSNNYLKDVICPIINSLNLTSINVLDPHSDVLEACLNNYEKSNNDQVFRFTYEHLLNSVEPEDLILLTPDAGAYKKLTTYITSNFSNENIITCSKKRDQNGKITKFQVPGSIDQLKNKHILIIDDICDGGGTFLNIAKSIIEKFQWEDSSSIPKLYLLVTHGIFSKGLKELNKYFKFIYCTNSYIDIDEPEFSLFNDGDLSKLIQLKVI